MNYKQFVIIVSGLVIKDNQLLLGKKEKKQHKIGIGGQWHIPGGKLDWGESPEQAVIRELKEETNLKVDPEGIIDVSLNHIVKGNVKSFGCTLWYHCSANEGNLKAQDDLIDTKWVKKEKLPDYLTQELIDHLPQDVAKLLELT